MLLNQAIDESEEAEEQNSIQKGLVNGRRQFTEEEAKEMRARVEKLINKSPKLLPEIKS